VIKVGVIFICNDPRHSAFRFNPIIVCVRGVNTVCLVEREKDLDGRHMVSILYSPYFSGGGHCMISNLVFIRKRSISSSDIIARIEILVTVVDLYLKNLTFWKLRC
jgi:hypothetical protein